MNSKQLIHMITHGRDLAEIKASLKYYIKVECGEKFRFMNYKILESDSEKVSMKIQFKEHGIWIPRDRKINKKLVQKRSIVLYKRAIVDTNINISLTKRKRKSKQPDLYTIIGKFFLDNGRLPTNAEITKMEA